MNIPCKPKKPAIILLKSKQVFLSTEINQLNRELLALKDIIRHKQKEIRIINTALIQKATRRSFLSIVKSTPIYQASQQLNTQTGVNLVCLPGGKQSSK